MLLQWFTQRLSKAQNGAEATPFVISGFLLECYGNIFGLPSSEV